MKKDLWLKKFIENFYPKLNVQGEELYQRGEGFKIIFESLLKKKDNNFAIIETGVTRALHEEWKDGLSTFLFLDFLNEFSGELYSVDIAKKSIKRARSLFGNNKSFNPVHSDSISWLSSKDLEHVDLFYLDSYDVSWNDDSLSSDHHLKEFKIIEPFLKKGSIVAIDDNIKKENLHVGKGSKIFKYLYDKNIYPIFDDYQIIYIW